jgi:hypothetical protein
VTDSLSAYQKHGFIRRSIDLLAAGAAWRGGSFTTREGNPSVDAHPSVSDATLVSTARSMLLTGAAGVAIAKVGDAMLISAAVQSADSPDVDTIQIYRVESELDGKGRPILAPALDQVAAYEKLMETLARGIDAVEPIQMTLDAIHSVLGVRSYMLDQGRISQTHVLALKEGALMYNGEVQALRHNMFFGLNQVADRVAEILGLPGLQWRWNEEWDLHGPCGYGVIYQIFLGQGLALEPIRSDEVGAMEMLVKSEIMSKQRLRDCLEKYGLT